MAATKIPKRLIGTLDNDNIEAGAGIETTKLADGADFIQRDGSVAFTGDIDAGNNKIENVSAPSAGADAANKTYVDNAIAALGNLYANKFLVRVASTANVTISNPGTAVFDGVTLSNGDLILLKNQSSAAENGIYTFNGSGSAMTRAGVMDAWSEVPGALVIATEGTANADTLWLSTANAGGTLNTTAITFVAQVSTAGLVDSNFVDNEAVSGTVNGSNTAFTLANTPTAGTVHLYLNGVRLKSGSGNDYTISGSAITMLTAPLTGEVLTADYRK